MTRRVISMLLAAVALFGLWVPAYAADAEQVVSGQNEISPDGDGNTPENTDAADPTASPEPTAVPEPTATPEPTAVPEPTASPEPTVVPEPTASPEPSPDPNMVELRNEDGSWYCYDGTGSKVKGWKVIDGERYYFRASDGKMQTGWIKLQDKDTGTYYRYYLADDGKLRQGRQVIDGAVYILKEGDLQDRYTGSVQTGWVIDTATGKKYFLKSTGKASVGWTKLKDKASGVYYRYYFNEQGELQTGETLEVDGAKYFLRDEGLDSKYTGSVLTGWYIRPGTTEKYFLKSTGQVSVGWTKLKDKASGVYYRYYFDGNGVLQIGRSVIDGTVYFLKEGDLQDKYTGSVQTGWVIDSATGKKYFVKSTGQASVGWTKLKDKASGVYYQYYFNEQGELQTGETLEVGGAKYFLRDEGLDSKYTGSVLTGWYIRPGTTEKYFLKSTGQASVGWTKLKDKASGKYYRYYFNEQGVLQTGETLVVDGTKYFLRSEGLDSKYTGSVLTGWYNAPNGNRYYFKTDTGAMLVGFQTVSGSKYYFEEADLNDPNAGALALGWKIINNSKYYFETSGGKMRTGFQTVNGSKYYFNSSGVMLIGWQTIDGKKYYLKEGDLNDESTGVMATGRTEIDGKTYYLTSNGSLATGVTYLSEYDDMYYFTDSGEMVMNQDVTLLGKKYHVDGNGRIEGYMNDSMRSAVAVLNKVGWNLRAAFNWSAGLTYSNRWMRASSSPHSSWYANYGFKNKTGNCYVMASTFYQMAKVLGYEVYFVEGAVRSTATYNAPHGWTEIILDGTKYVFDPNFTNETGRNGYQIWYGKSGTWQYVNYARES